MVVETMLTLPAQTVQVLDMTRMKTTPSRSATSVMAKEWLPWRCAQAVGALVKLK